MGVPTVLPPPVYEFARNLQIQDMFQVGLLTCLLYDHLITFEDEVERIWKRPWNGASVLFVINRYFTPLEFSVVIAAFQSQWSEEVCRRFVRYEGAGSSAIVGICEMVMILRVHALYGNNWTVLCCLSVCFAIQIALQAVALSSGIPLDAPVPSGCILLGRSSIYAALWVGPLVTDALIFGLTLWRSRRYMEKDARMPTLQLFLRDGTAYFFIIFSANLLNVIVYFTATDSLKAFFAPFSEIITSIMVSRIVLNLRGFRHGQGGDEETTFDSGPSKASQNAPLAFKREQNTTLYGGEHTTFWDRVTRGLGESDYPAVADVSDRKDTRARTPTPMDEHGRGSDDAVSVQVEVEVLADRQGEYDIPMTRISPV